MKTNFYGFLIATVLNISLVIAYPGRDVYSTKEFQAVPAGAKATVDAFECLVLHKSTQLNWSVTSNESTNHFILEKTTDGKNFKTVALIFSSEAKGRADYAYPDKTGTAPSSYRIRTLLNNGHSEYTAVIRPVSSNSIAIK